MRFSKSYFDDIRYFDEPYKRYLLVIFILALFLLPWMLKLSTYIIFVLSLIFVYSIVTVGLNILMGYTGQVSLGHAAFMAIGAYSLVNLISKAGLPFVLALPASGLIAGLLGVIVGPSALRIKGLYLALVTMCFGFIVDVVILEWPDMTNGSEGMLVPYASIGSLELDTDLEKYFLILTVAIIMLVIAKNLIRSRLGRAFVAIRDSDIAAETMGIDLAKYKIIAFGVSAFYAGIAGGLLAPLLGFIGPDNFSLFDSIAYLIMVVVGGMGSILGSIMGAAFMTLLPEVIRLFKDYFPDVLSDQKGIQAILYGLILILFIRFEPNGLYGRWLHIKYFWETFPLGKQMKTKKLIVSGGRRI
ncbi:branched-chain amino acid ABC transporter permease [Thermodesulfobacteriota bacterium]